MTNAGDWLAAFLITIVIILPILVDIGLFFKRRGKATKQLQAKLSVDTSKSIVERIHQNIMSFFDNVTNLLMKLKHIWGDIQVSVYLVRIGIYTNCLFSLMCYALTVAQS